MKKKKTQRWTKFRHRIVRNILFFILGPVVWIKYRAKIKKYRDPQKRRQFLVLFNHQTAFDQFFVGMAFKGPVYYLASEDLFSKGWISAVIRYLVAPIPIKKQTTDIKAIMNCIKVAKEGGTIALAPEGNRTFSGKTGYMSPAIASLARKLGLPIALMKIEGGYGVQPRWADTVRKGRINAYVSKIVEPAEYKQMTDAELFDVIEKELYVDEGIVSGCFEDKKKAEYLERAMYVCPDCGLSTFESDKNIIECKKCNKKIEYLATKELKGVNCTFPFEFVTQWYDYQCEFVNSLDVTQMTEKPIYVERSTFSQVIPNKKKVHLDDDAEICLYGDKITVLSEKTNITFDFNTVSAVTVLGRNKVNIYLDGNIYQLKGNKRMNGLKYVNIFNRYKNIAKGEENGKFLGL